MTDAELIADIRLTVVETLLSRLYASYLAQSSPSDSIQVKKTLIATAESWEVFPGSPPQDVSEASRRMRLVGHYTRHFVNVLDEREKDIRERQGLPRADLPDKDWS